MSKLKIVVCDHIHQDGLKIIENRTDVQLINASDVDKDTLKKEYIPQADVIITRSSTDIDKDFLQHATRLKSIIRAGVGVDNVDIESCSKNGIVVMNIPTANTIAAVELTMTHILSCVRKFPYAHNNLKVNRIWRRQDWYGTELKDKKLGIIGFGNIGSRVGKRAQSFEMEIIVYDPYIKSSTVTDLGMTYSKNFNDILACDIITIHTPKTEETIGIISYNEITKMKDGVILINCARGGLYNEEALFDGLKSKKIAMAGIDVFNKEPSIHHPLLDLDNVIVTPHLGANTKESQKNIAIQSIENALLAIKGISYPNALNLPFKENELPKELKLYFDLMQKMGYISAQVTKSSIKSIKISAEGSISNYLDSLYTFAAVGALQEFLGEHVNYINVDFIAKDRGIKFYKEKLLSHSGLENKIVLKLTTEHSIFSISGTVLDNSLQRIIEIDNYMLELEPSGKMILFRNTDTLGVIGDVGKIIAEHKINISDFRLGRDSNSRSLAVVKVDGNISKELILELSNLEACLGISYVNIL